MADDTEKNHYRVEPTDDRPAVTVLGTRYVHDDTSGLHKIYDGDELVATLLNVSVRKIS